MIVLIESGLTYVLLLCAAIHDFRRHEVRRWMLAAAAVLGGAASVTGLLTQTADPLILGVSILPGGALLAAAFLTRDGIGYGDGLMALLLGPVYGADVMMAGLCLAFLFSALCSVVLLVLKKADRKTCLPFIPFLLLALGVVQLAFK